MFELDELQYYPVNWTDGMRVTAKDFARSDRAWMDALRDVRASLFQGAQYGLLPPLRDSSDKSPYPKINYEPARSLITLQECRAITEGGYRIEITEALHRNSQVPLNLPKARLDKQEDCEIYVSVDLFTPQGAGPMTTDAPPRHQFISPFYELSVLPKSDGVGLSGFNHLKIAEYKWVRGHFERDEQYIPSCLTMTAHAALSDRFLKAGSYLKTIHDNSIHIVRQYRSDPRPDVKDAALWIEKLVLFISGSLWSYNDTLINESPAKVIVYFKNFGQYVLSTTDCYEANLFMKDGARSQRQLFKDLADPNFNTDDLRTAFNRIDVALKGMHVWLKALAESFKQGRVIKVEEIRS
jgi:hypothetical protein